jgi:hypothetical protein
MIDDPITDKILFVIMHGINCQHRYDNVINTWGKNINHIFYSDYEDIGRNIIKTSDKTGYYSLEEKMLNVVKTIYENFKDYEWFLFCDDDTYINVKKLFLELPNFNKDFVYGQILLHGWRENPEVIFCSGGAGTLIHKNNLEKIQNNITNHNIGIADVSFCMNLTKNNIKIIHSNLFYNNTPQSIGLEKINYNNYISFHNIKTLEQMLDIHTAITNTQ